MRVPNRVAEAVHALALTQAHADLQRHRAALVGLGASLESNGISGQLSVDAEQWAPFLRFAAPGHFYSPIPRLDDVRRDADRIWRQRDELPGIDLRLDAQHGLIERIAAELGDERYPATQVPERRYYTENPAFCVGDATVLEGMLRLHAPRRIVEIGSGFSSALILDVVERHLSDTSVTFVEPYPQLLHELMRPGDEARGRVLEARAQDVPPDVIAELGPGDILFIDSTHVVRIGNDVCHLILEVLPTLAPGVIVHIHDIFWPFEPPWDWVLEGRQWSEPYLVRAMLTDSPRWEVLLFNDYVGRIERAHVERHLPQVIGNAGGSLWLRRAG